MNILYLHGLDSRLSEQKMTVLKKFGTVHEPHLNYYENENAIDTVLNYCSNRYIDVVIGSSMGGFAGYHVANALDLPALLFNPALKKRSVGQNISIDKNSYNQIKHIIIGQIDEVVIPRDTLDYLQNNFNEKTDLHLHLVPQLGHNIPVTFFEEKVRSFLERMEKIG